MTNTRAGTSGAWVKPAKQDRARRTFERALDAAATLLAERGYDGFSIAEVCRLAAVSPGALYGRVDGKDELFLALHEREVSRTALDAIALYADGPRWEGLSPAGHVRAVVTTFGRHLVDEAPLLRPFFLRAAVDARIAGQGARASEVVEQAAIDRLLARADDFRQPSDQEAATDAYRLAADSFRWRIAFGPEFADADLSTPPPSYLRWVDRVADMCCASLLAP